MTVEAILTRALEITFIDARKLAMEAKLEKNIVGYLSEEQQTELVSRAIEIFQAKPEHDKIIMKQIKVGLDSCKIKNGSLSSRASDHSSASNSNNGNMRRVRSNDGLSQGSNHSRRNRIGRNRSGNMLMSMMGGRSRNDGNGGMRRIVSSGSTAGMRRSGGGSSSSSSMQRVESLATFLQRTKLKSSKDTTTTTTTTKNGEKQQQKVDIDKLLLHGRSKKTKSPASALDDTESRPKPNFTWNNPVQVQ